MARFDLPVSRAGRTLRRDELETLARRRNQYRRFINFSVKRLLPGALAILFGTATYQALTLPEFNIDRIEVTGNRLVPYTDIMAVATVPTGNIFLLDRASVRNSVARIRRLSSVEVRLLLPATVSIAVEERRPVAIWHSEDRDWLVDDEGLVLGLATSEVLPALNDLDNAPVSVEEQVSAELIAAARAAVQLVPQELGLPVTSVDYRRTEGVSFMSDRGWRAILGVAPPASNDPGPPAKQALRQQEYIRHKIAVLKAVADEVSRSRVTPSQIDVRFGDRPYIR